MKTFYLLIALNLFLLSCNDRKTEGVAETDSVTIPAVDNTRAELDTLPSGARDLTDAEMLDDSVFTDGSIPTTWEVAGINDPRSFKLFLKKLKHWVEADLRDSVANAVNYPMLNPKSVKTASDFLKHYDELMTPSVKDALKNQQLNQVFRNYKGAMVGNIWISDASNNGSGNYKIISINN